MINPWLLGRTAPSAESADWACQPMTNGPSRPQQGGRMPTPDPVLPSADRTEARPQLWILGVHGGAGETSIAATRPDWAEAEHRIPVMEPERPGRVLLTCRTHIPGLLAAQAAATQWADGGLAGLDLLGLVLIADAPGRPSRAIRDLAQVVAGGVPRCWRLPWCEAWRHGEHPPAVRLPRPVTRLLDDLDELTARPAGYPHSPILEGLHHHASPGDDHRYRLTADLVGAAADSR